MMFRIHSALGSYCPTTNLGDSPYSAPPHGCPREVNFKLHSQQTPPMKSFIKEAFLGILQLSIGEATKSPTYESNCQPFQRLNKVTCPPNVKLPNYFPRAKLQQTAF